MHYVGFCFRVPGDHYRSFDAYGEEQPEAHAFNVRCRDCFPAPKLEQRQQEAAAEASDSSGSSSSASSSSSSAGAEAQG